MGQHVHQSGYRLQKSRVRIPLVSLGSESSHSLPLILQRQLIDARDTYKKVIEIDPRNVPALVFLGSVYQLLDDPDRAIIKYHEVSGTAEFPSTAGCVNRVSQALSLNPINGQAIALLDVSLDATSYVRPKEAKPMPSWMKIAFGKPQAVTTRPLASPTGADVDESSVDGST